jgi:hypothetical protein
MLIAGTGITSFNAKIQPNYVPATVYALQWIQGANGTWYCVDRGSAADVYDVEISLYKDETTINNFINQIQANRESYPATGANILQLSEFNVQECIFGADIDYSGTINATAFMERRIQGSWKGFGISLRLSALSPGFVGVTGVLPTLRFLDVGYDADANYTINKLAAYDTTEYYQDHAADDGSFTGVYTFDPNEMIALRRFVATNRGAAFTTPSIIGVAAPWGRMEATSTVNMTYFEDMGMSNFVNGLPRWRAKITLSQVY